jgi:hypothetical protein
MTASIEQAPRKKPDLCTRFNAVRSDEVLNLNFLIGEKKALTIRPELRVDHSFRPFNDSSDDTIFTAAIDVILGF